MSFFSDLKAERLIAEIRGFGDPLHPESQKAFQKLAKIGAGAIPKILDALAVADKKETASYVDILSQLIDNKTFPILAEGLADGNARTVAAVSWALANSRNYSPGLLTSSRSDAGGISIGGGDVIGGRRPAARPWSGDRPIGVAVPTSTRRCGWSRCSS